MPTAVPFTLFAGHLALAPVTVDGRLSTSFIFDTGIGLKLLSDRLRKDLGHPLLSRTHVGRRMSGQQVALPLTQVDSLTLGTLRQDRPVIGSYDFEAVLEPEGTVGGFLSLGFFEHSPITMSYRRSHLTLEDEQSLASRARAGTAVPVSLRHNGAELEMFLDLVLPSGSVARVEVDTGSDHLILHERYMGELGLREGSDGVERHEGTDETGHRFVRFRGRVPGTVHVRGFGGVRQDEPKVIFQNIIHDGLVGRDFLLARDVTYDVAASRMIFGPTD